MTTKFGVEIECVGWGGSTAGATRDIALGNFAVVNEGMNSYFANPRWRVVREYSIHDGVEIISPPLPFNTEGLDSFGRMLRHIQSVGASMDRRCGMHVHVDASFLNALSENERRNFFIFLLSAYQQNEHIFDRFVKANRRGDVNRYCKSLQNKSFDDIMFDREHKLNVNRAFSTHGTIEFRHFHGTLNDSAATAWVKLCVTFLKNVAQAYGIAIPATAA